VGEADGYQVRPTDGALVRTLFTVSSQAAGASPATATTSIIGARFEFELLSLIFSPDHAPRLEEASAMGSLPGAFEVQHHFSGGSHQDPAREAREAHVYEECP